jgi:hypothetical protein
MRGNQPGGHGEEDRGLRPRDTTPQKGTTGLAKLIPIDTRLGLGLMNGRTYVPQQTKGTHMRVAYVSHSTRPGRALVPSDRRDMRIQTSGHGNFSTSP